MFQISTIILHKTYQGCNQLDKMPHSTMKPTAQESDACQVLGKQGGEAPHHSVDKHQAASYLLKTSFPVDMTDTASSTGSSTNSCVMMRGTIGEITWSCYVYFAQLIEVPVGQHGERKKSTAQTTVQLSAPQAEVSYVKPPIHTYSNPSCIWTTSIQTTLSSEP